MTSTTATMKASVSTGNHRAPDRKRLAGGTASSYQGVAGIIEDEGSSLEGVDRGELRLACETGLQVERDPDVTGP